MTKMKSTNAEWSTLKIVPDSAVSYLRDCHTKNRINKKIKINGSKKVSIMLILDFSLTYKMDLISNFFYFFFYRIQNKKKIS